MGRVHECTLLLLAAIHFKGNAMIFVVYMGWLLYLIGVVWIVYIAFKNEAIIWAIASFFCFLAAIIYGIQHFDEAKFPLGLLGVGFVLNIIGQVLVMQSSGG